MSSQLSDRSVHARVSGLACLLFVLSFFAACSGTPDAPDAPPPIAAPNATPSRTVPRSGTTPASSNAVTGVSSQPQPGARSRLAGFGEVTITVTSATGQKRTWCLMLADTEALRDQGLMFVEDAAIGGYDGMLFSFDSDTSGAFWMKDTRLALSIAYLKSDGSTVSKTDMTPCGTITGECPIYPAAGRYRYAIEVPHGQLEKLGVSDRSLVGIGPRSCAAPAT